MLKVKQFIFNPFGVCTYVVSDEVTHDAIIVDPGMDSPDEERRLIDYIETNGLKVTGIVNTHLHLDHCFGVNSVKNRYGVKLSAHPGDAALGRKIATQAMRFGLSDERKPVEIDVELHDGDTIRVGDETLQVLGIPGHSPGGIALYSASGKFVLTGDSLFQHSIGRTDLEGGDLRVLVEGVREKLLTLPGDTLVLPGHGAATTVAEECSQNPFVR